MKRFGVALFALVLWLSLGALGQNASQQQSPQSTDKSSTADQQAGVPQQGSMSQDQTAGKKAHAKSHLMGKISDSPRASTGTCPPRAWGGTLRQLPYVTLPCLSRSSRAMCRGRESARRDNAKAEPRKSFKQIIYCRECRQLQLISMKDEHFCPSCKSDLIIQS